VLKALITQTKPSEVPAMRRIPRWFWLVLLVAFFGLIGIACQPDSTDDDSDLPWTQPEGWEGGPPIGIGM
jgi:hypothetical protein